MKNQVEYYNNKYVIDRILDYYHGFEKGHSVRGSKYPVGYGESEVWRGNPNAYWAGREDKDIFKITQEQGLDVFTSMWRDDGTFAILDIEYFNHDYPGEPYVKSYEVFQKIEPVYQIIVDVFHSHGIYPLKVMTGQGYHFSSLWPFTENHELLEELGTLEFTMEEQYKNYKKVTSPAGRGYNGICRLLQFLTHEVIRRADEQRRSGQYILPVVFSDIDVGSVGQGIYGNGREAISLDLTLYSDPIYMRDVRIPFSTHQKHKVQRYKVGEHTAESTPIAVCPPRSDLNLNELLRMRRLPDNRHFRICADYASQVRTTIPRAHEGWKNVLMSYKKSELYEFHKKFDSQNHNYEFDWQKTYLGYNLDELPPCIRYAVQNPNDHLLKPTNLQGLIRVLDKKGWHPKHIAGFIYARYKNMKNWGRNNAERLANFWTEIYLGALYSGVDKKIDMNCVSQQERGYCINPFCGYNLEDYK